MESLKEEAEMEEKISNFSKSIGSFCNHLQSSSEALKQSIDRRPIPLDSASSTFIQCLNRRVSSASSDLNLLESMSFGTVSFEELLGHCNEVYKNNQNHIFELQDRLKSFGYVASEFEIDDEEEDSIIYTPVGLDSSDCLDTFSAYDRPVSAAGSITKNLEEDPLMDESLSLKSLGLSDACLAALASEENAKMNDPDVLVKESAKYYGDRLPEVNSLDQTTAEMRVTEGKVDAELKPIGAPSSFIKASRDDYEGLPSYMKSLTSWEDLLTAVDKINSSLRKKERTKGTNYFHQHEISSMDLGPKARTYLLLLTRMNQLVVETIDGLISYRVL